MRGNMHQYLSNHFPHQDISLAVGVPEQPVQAGSLPAPGAEVFGEPHSRH